MGMDFEIVIDIVDSPNIYLIPVNSEKLIDLFEGGLLTPNGLSRVNFYKKLFDIRVEKIDEVFGFEITSL